MVANITGGSFLTHQSHFDTDRMAGSVPVWKNDGDGSSDSKINQAEALASNNNNDVSNTQKPPSLSFGEFLDIINPLQHIPVVGSLYRSMTGDELSPVARIVGGGLYGGPIGFVTSIVTAAMDEHGGGSALINGFNNASHPHYAMNDEPRTAGLV